MYKLEGNSFFFFFVFYSVLGPLLTKYPAEYFTVFETPNPTIDVSLLHKVRLTTEFEALKLRDDQPEIAWFVC